MNHSVTHALWSFSERFVSAWNEQHGSKPQSDAYIGLASPCIVQETDDVVIWQPIQRDAFADFSNVEEGIGISLHEDVISFYAGLYCGDMTAQFEGLSLELIQVWSDEDLPRLQENMLGHLLMQKRLKQNPTVFIAATDDELDVISICNVTGEVIKERIGTKIRDVLAPNVETFLQHLSPEV
ncbi:SecY-interacting protein [Enterovibrio norvegicus]|uniref:Protein Syd n=1 Tax=Enterovibrio norvegicus DSM 15893 TaxID=1121869 RepID=A0A1I5W0D8_9GAMM|nr:SecY-interacting protein [Enterovibrio norvegicus]MCC4799327.1 SecY-interacting protein [Enterovibrio norvegicus]OEF51256.1 SecY-interacting protein [Enterovibrio norvegicus]PMH64202.1 SecY-interacting protein [Enterovibrio norvegicus]PMI28975.1 SecY-interacting protein [Enterovibrio norvegicus]PMI37795.1 SecY-interacting protein [Enterovibrio norvegicus]